LVRFRSLMTDLNKKLNVYFALEQAMRVQTVIRAVALLLL
jgi:hypothetical protein